MAFSMKYAQGGNAPEQSALSRMTDPGHILLGNNKVEVLLFRIHAVRTLRYGAVKFKEKKAPLVSLEPGGSTVKSYAKKREAINRLAKSNKRRAASREGRPVSGVMIPRLAAARGYYFTLMCPEGQR